MKKIIVTFILLVILGFTFFQYNSNNEILKAATNGVEVTCESYDCYVDFLVFDYETSSISLQQQFDEIKQQISTKRVKQIKFLPDERDYLTPEEWTIIKNEMDFSKMQSIDASGIKISTGTLPEMAFVKDLDSDVSLQYLYLPQIETITVDSLKGLASKKKIDTLSLPESVTAIESNALVGVMKERTEWGYYMDNRVEVNGDMTNYIDELRKASVDGLEFDLSKQSQLGTFAYLNDFSGLIRLTIKSDTPPSLDLDQLFNTSSTNNTLSSLISYQDFEEFKSTKFSNLSSHVYKDGTTTSYIFTNSNVSTVPSIVGAIPSSVTFDISKNKIDFTEARNKAFYEANKDNHTLGEQKPILKTAKLNDINLTVDDAAPTITPTYVYADGSSINFEDTCPEWMDSSYYQAYKGNVTYKDNPTLNMAKVGTYVRKFYASGNVEIGSVKIIVKAAAKETPTITLTNDATATTTNDDEITFTATMGKTGSNDLNTNATIIFKDGESVLDTVNVTNDKATYTGKLSAGSHTIKAVYSGNTNFETVTSSDASVTIVEATPPELTSQTIGFTNSQQEITYGDQVPENAITQSNPHGTGAITYTSSNPLIASIDTNGDVTVHKVGRVTITADIAEDATYASATGSYTLVIKPKSIQLQGYTMKDKEYDGTKTASYDKGVLTLSDVLTTDVNDLGLDEGSLTLDAENAGTHQVVFNDFALTGSAKDNYTLTYPALQARITKAPLRVVAHDVDKKQGEGNPTFTYLITGFKNSETEASISGYTKPTLTSIATQDSPIGEYAIVASGAIADNYSFIYIDGILKIEAVDNELPIGDYEITGISGKNDWYVSDVVIKPSKDFVEVWDGITWVKELRFGDNTNKEILLKFRKADGTVSEEVRKTIKVDTAKPSVDNLVDGATYYLNRNFICNDTNLSKVIIDGKEVTDFNALQLAGNASKTTTIVVEDAAGNTTTLHVVTKPIDEIQESIKELDENTVTKKDESTINAVLKEVNELLADESYQPSSEQKDKLIEQKEKCEALLKTLKKTPEGEGKEEAKEPTSNKVVDEIVQEGVSTGDSQSMLPFLILAIAIIGITISVYMIKKDEA